MRNRSWEKWGGAGIALGALLTIFGILLQALEISRVYKGVINRESVNFNKNITVRESRLFNPLLSLTPVLWLGPSLINQLDTMWPWSFPGLFLGLLSLAAGVLGCVASRHKTYGSILGFAVLSLLTTGMSAFAIGYYSLIVHLYNSRWNGTTFLASDKFDGRISRALLSFSVITLVTALLATLVAAKAIGACTPKGRFRRPMKPGIRAPLGYVRPMPYRPF